MFMNAFRLLLVHGGKGIVLRPGAANCVAQDETIQLKVAPTSSDRMQIMIQKENENTVETEFVLEDQLNQETVHEIFSRVVQYPNILIPGGNFYRFGIFIRFTAVHQLLTKTLQQCLIIHCIDDH